MTTSKSDPRPAALDDAEALIRRVTEYEAKATPGPWEDHGTRTVWACNGDIPVCELEPHVLRTEREGRLADDRAFIAQSRTDLPRAIALLRVLVERVRELEKEVENRT
jgi:hypothetical protein